MPIYFMPVKKRIVFRSKSSRRTIEAKCSHVGDVAMVAMAMGSEGNARAEVLWSCRKSKYATETRWVEMLEMARLVNSTAYNET